MFSSPFTDETKIKDTHTQNHDYAVAKGRTETYSLCKINFKNFLPKN